MSLPSGGRSGSMIMSVAAAAITVTNPAEMDFSDNATSRQLTNGQSLKIQVDVLAGIRTNTTIITYAGAPYVASGVTQVAQPIPAVEPAMALRSL